jgi:hypothetical protein
VRRVFNATPQIHHRNPIRDVFHHARVVRNE